MQLTQFAAGQYDCFISGHVDTVSQSCSNNVSVSRHFFDTTTFTVYVTACRVPYLEKSVKVFGKQLRLKTIDTFIHVYTQCSQYVSYSLMNKS